MVDTAFLFATQTEAQVILNMNENVVRPSWGVPGNYAGDYYYLPEIDSYYDIPHRQFIYFDGRGWVNASQLPYQYRDYDLFGGYKVVVNEPRPYMRADVYRKKYNRYYNTYRRPAYGNNRNDRNDRYDNDKYSRGRDNQHFDNKRREAVRNDGGRNGQNNGNGNGRKW
ncbi:MAG: hypothetical protein JWQ78_2064 [Sediminibacterium sp.]|nr:hypothetical protein [Sediminibacterium sp.]